MKNFLHRIIRNFRAEKRFAKFFSAFVLVNYFMVFCANAETILFTFDDENSRTFDGSVRNSGTTSSNADVYSEGGVRFRYLEGYHNMYLEYAPEASTSSRIKNVKITSWGQKFMLEARIRTEQISSGTTLDIIKSTGTPTAVHWYITSDSKIYLKLNNGSGVNVTTYVQCPAALINTSESQWIMLYAAVDLTQASLTNAVQMFVYCPGYGQNLVYGSNYYGTGAEGDAVYTGTTGLPSTTDGAMIVKHYNHLTVEEGAELKPQYRCRGMMILVNGDLTINGKITMTARGASGNPATAFEGYSVSSSGLKLSFITLDTANATGSSNLDGCGSAAKAVAALFPTISNVGKIITIQRSGGSGGGSVSARQDRPGIPGVPGYSPGTGYSGGGGGGGTTNRTDTGQPSYYARSGYGATGTCFSGGSGGGAGTTVKIASNDQTPYNAAPYGGKGGNTYTTWFQQIYGGGGAGNPGGTYSYSTYMWEPGCYPPGAGPIGIGENGGNGTGGLLIIVVKGNIIFGPSGEISADGVRGGNALAGQWRSGGGGSGGGNIVLAYGGGAGFYSGKTLANSVHANGGAGGIASGSSLAQGGKGGNGSVQIVNLQDPTGDSIIKLAVNTSGVYSTSVSTRSFKADTVDLFQRSGNFAARCDYIKLKCNETGITYPTDEELHEEVIYISEDASAWLTIDPDNMVKRVTNKGSEIDTNGHINSPVYESFPANIEAFHGVFEINFQLNTTNYSGNLIVNYFIKRPEDSDWLKIGQKTHYTNQGTSVKYYWDSHKSAYDWTYDKTNPYMTESAVQFKFEIE